MSRSTPRMIAATLERVVDRRRAEAEALPGLVELGGEDPVHVEVAGRDRQVGRLERAAALLVDDVERADQADVVEEVGGVAGSPAAVEVADEGRAADGAEDEVGATEDEVPGRVPGVERELRGGQRDERLDLLGIEPDAPGRPVDACARAREQRRAPGRRGPPSRSRTGSAARRGGSPRPGRRSGARPAGTG